MKKLMLLILLLTGCTHSDLPEMIGRSSNPIGGFKPGTMTNPVIPGELIVDPPTYNNLGFRWYIDGDGNRNASLKVYYRPAEHEQWRESLPPLRVYHEIVDQDYYPYRCGNLFAGSIISLEPGREYEIKLEMQDPDGGAPAQPRTLRISTLAEPQEYTGGRTLHVFPDSYNGQLNEVSYAGLVNAYKAAEPGDILLLAPGLYRGPMAFEKSGEPGRPIVFKGSDRGDAIIEGYDYETDLIDIRHADHLVFENLVFRRAKAAIRGGGKGYQSEGHDGAGASWIVIRNCRFYDIVTGIITYSENSEYWLISDNEITGINAKWFPRQRGKAHTGVNIYGRGHVVRFNRITDFWDGIAIANFGHPPPNLNQQAVSIDFHNNDIQRIMDDAIEADFGCHNVRVYRNRCINTHTGISVQPFYGGPVYIFRNEIYAASRFSFKLSNYPAGIMAYHNTIGTKSIAFRPKPIWQNGHFRNNLFMSGKKHAMSTGSLSSYSTMDFNGYGRAEPDRLIQWTFSDRTRWGYNSLDEFFDDTGNEKSGREVTFDIFLDAAAPRPGKTYHPDDYDLRLQPASKAVDAGLFVPQVSQGFSGSAPDLGCYEQGQQMTPYGPRR